MPELVIPERREEIAGPGELRELRGNDRTAAGGPGPELVRMGDLPGGRHVVDEGELRPFDMTDDCASHNRASLHV